MGWSVSAALLTGRERPQEEKIGVDDGDQTPGYGLCRKRPEQVGTVTGAGIEQTARRVAAQSAAIDLLKDHGKESLIQEVYEKCLTQRR